MLCVLILLLNYLQDLPPCRGVFVRPASQSISSEGVIQRRLVEKAARPFMPRLLRVVSRQVSAAVAHGPARFAAGTGHYVFHPAAFPDLPFLFTPALRFEGCGGISKS